MARRQTSWSGGSVETQCWFEHENEKLASPSLIDKEGRKKEMRGTAKSKAVQNECNKHNLLLQQPNEVKFSRRPRADAARLSGVVKHGITISTPLPTDLRIAIQIPKVRDNTRSIKNEEERVRGYRSPAQVHLPRNERRKGSMSWETMRKGAGTPIGECE